MDEQERQALERVEHLSEENNELLHKLYRAEKRRFWFRIFYWTLIIALSLGAYYALQPYLDFIQNFTGVDFNFRDLVDIPGGKGQ